MNNKFFEIYLELILKQKDNRQIESPFFLANPEMYNGIITPDSSIITNPMWETVFSIDAEGMKEILNNLESTIMNYTDKQKNDLAWIAKAVDFIINNYFGGTGDAKNRKIVYSQNDDHLKLSDIHGRSIGLCAERASVAQNCFEVLREIGILRSYIPYLTISRIINDGNINPHAFIILVNEQKCSWLFDIENDIKYLNRDGTPTQGLAFYQMSKEELERFKEGQSIQLKSIYELYGYKLCGKSRFYGSEDSRTLSEKLNEKRALKIEQEELHRKNALLQKKEYQT